MIKIAICDDEEKELTKTKGMCDSYASKYPEYDIRISTFATPVELMLYMEQNKFDILFLDIYMPQMTGIELARSLRNKNDDCQIIFLTTSLTHAVEAFSLHAAHYLVKPFMEEQFVDAMSKAIASIEKVSRTHIMLKTSSGVQKIVLADFLYAETMRHVQSIHMTEGKCLQVRMTSTELFEMLRQDNRFFKCGSTYILNLDKIEEVTLHTINFENGIQLPMQRRQYKELLSKYTGYLLEES